jgi:hypothetical protein
MERSPHQAAKVEDLTISFGILDGSTKRMLCDIFPNVRRIKLGCNDGQYHYANFSQPTKTIHTTSRVQSISDHAFCEYASQMVTSNLCTQLCTLTLDFDRLYNGFQKILPQMKNMPVLKKTHPYYSRHQCRKDGALTQ